MKKCLLIAILFFVLSASYCLYEANEYRKESDWFVGLSDDWHLFEADYTEDIKNIDKLRDDLKWERDVCLGWERIAMQAIDQELKWKMKYKEQWTINNVGLLSKGEIK